MITNQIPYSAIWLRLNAQGMRFVTRETIGLMAAELCRDTQKSIDYLQRNGYLYRVFRGIFYVPDHKERALGRPDRSIHELVSQGLRQKGEKIWYFGMESALALNGMTHEHFDTEYVITGSYYTGRPIDILGKPVMVIAWKDPLLIPEAIKSIRTSHSVTISYSDPEKTVLDLAYRRYTTRRRNVVAPLLEYGPSCDRDVLMRYLKRYPPTFRTIVGACYES